MQIAPIIPDFQWKVPNLSPKYPTFPPIRPHDLTSFAYVPPPSQQAIRLIKAMDSAFAETGMNPIWLLNSVGFIILGLVSPT